MTVAINARFIQDKNIEGIGNYTWQMVNGLTAEMPNTYFYLLIDRPLSTNFTLPGNAEFVIVGPAARHPLLWHYWYNVKVPNILKRLKADLFISPDNFCSLTTKVPQLLVLHDLAYLHQPSAIKKSHLWYYKTFTKRFASKANHIITVSAFSKQDIMGQLQVPEHKLSVVYNTVKDIFQPTSWETNIATKEKYTAGAGYFICVTSIHPRKNIINLLKAFSIFKKWQKSDMKLVIVGRMAWKNDGFNKLLQHYKYKNDVVLTGYLPDSEVAKLVAAAYCAVYPSLFEGFGVPIIEAMHCDVPVICSQTSGMIEAGGPAAYFFNPEDIDDLASQMQHVYKDENTRSKKIELGRLHIQQFKRNNFGAQIKQIIEQKFSLKQ